MLCSSKERHQTLHYLRCHRAYCARASTFAHEASTRRCQASSPLQVPPRPPFASCRVRASLPSLHQNRHHHQLLYHVVVICQDFGFIRGGEIFSKASKASILLLSPLLLTKGLRINNILSLATSGGARLGGGVCD